MIGNIRVHADILVEEQFCATSDQVIYNRFVVPSTKETHLALNADLFKKYVGDALGIVNDCYVVKAVEGGQIERLGKTTVVIRDREKRREAK